MRGVQSKAAQGITAAIMRARRLRCSGEAQTIYSGCLGRIRIEHALVHHQADRPGVEARQQLRRTEPVERNHFCQRVGERTARRDDGDARWMRQRSARAAIEERGHTFAEVIRGRRGGGVSNLAGDEIPGRPTRVAQVKWQPRSAKYSQIASGVDDTLRRACRAERVHRAIDGVTFGNTTQIQRYRAPCRDVPRRDQGHDVERSTMHSPRSASHVEASVGRVMQTSRKAEHSEGLCIDGDGAVMRKSRNAGKIAVAVMRVHSAMHVPNCRKSSREARLGCFRRPQPDFDQRPERDAGTRDPVVSAWQAMHRAQAGDERRR